MSNEIKPVVYSVASAVAATGGVIKQSRMYDLVRSGAIEARQMDGEPVIFADSLRSYLENLPLPDMGMRSRPTWRRPPPKPIDGVPSEQFSKILKAWREKRKISSRQAAKILGAHPALIGFWERGTRMPRDVLKIIDYIEKTDGMEKPPTLVRKISICHANRIKGHLT